MPIRLAFLAGLALAASCDLDPTSAPNMPPALEFVNASLRTRAVDLHLDASSASLSTVPLVPLGVGGGCPFVLPGTHLFEFIQNDTAYAGVEGTLAANATYLVMLVDAVANGDTTYRVLVAGDDVQAAASGSTGIRLINGTSVAGDVYVTAPADDPTPATLVLSGVAPAALAESVDLSFFMRPESATRVRLFDVGSTTNARADILLEPTGNRRLTTVIFTDRESATDQGGVQVNACS